MDRKYSEREIDQRIDEIQEDLFKVSAETRNTLHACRPDHPMGRGRDRTDLFRSAAFVLGGRMCPQKHIVWLNQVANQFHEERA